MPAGYVTHQNAYVLNGIFATAEVQNDINRAMKRGRLTYVAPYTATVAPADRGVHRGELLWDRMGPTGGLKLGPKQEPHLRSALNGVSVVDTGEGDQRNLEKLESEIRVFGVARKDVAYDVTRPELLTSDDPVAVVASLGTVHNTGEGPIRPGQMIEWYLVPTNHRHQIRDGVTFYSPNRATLGMRPFCFDPNVETMCAKDDAFHHVFKDFVNTFIPGISGQNITHPMFDILMEAVQLELINAYASTGAIATQAAPRGKRLDAMVVPFAKAGIKPKRGLVPARSAAAPAPTQAAPAPTKPAAAPIKPAAKPTKPAAAAAPAPKSSALANGIHLPKLEERILRATMNQFYDNLVFPANSDRLTPKGEDEVQAVLRSVKLLMPTKGQDPTKEYVDSVNKLYAHFERIKENKGEVFNERDRCMICSILKVELVRAYTRCMDVVPYPLRFNRSKGDLMFTPKGGFSTPLSLLATISPSMLKGKMADFESVDRLKVSPDTHELNLMKAKNLGKDALEVHHGTEGMLDEEEFE